MQQKGSLPFTPPRCRDCFYVLEGLDAVRCPECGRPFDLTDPGSFTTRLPLVRWKLWLPGLLLAAACGSVTWGAFLVAGAPIGWGVTLATPFAIGGLLGYRCPSRPYYMALAIVAAVLAISPLVVAGVMGLFCGVMAAAVVVIPAALGGLFGWLLRRRLKAIGFDQAGWLPVLALLLLPPAVTLVDWLAPAAAPVVSVRTQRLVNAPPQKTWESLRFYDDLGRSPPLLFRLGLPRPLETFGPLEELGDEQVCRYDTGTVRKRLTVVDPPRRLEFTVMEQRIGLEGPVHLHRGTFELEPDGSGRTRLTLTTEYEARLRPRFCWKPLEILSVRTLHKHILDGIAAEAARGTPVAARGEGTP